MLYLVVHQPRANLPFVNRLKELYPGAVDVQISTWLIPNPGISDSAELLEVFKHVKELDKEASLLVTEVSGKVAGWRTFPSTEALVEIYKTEGRPPPGMEWQ